MHWQLVPLTSYTPIMQASMSFIATGHNYTCTESGLAAAVSGVSGMARLVSESGAAAPEEVV